MLSAWAIVTITLGASAIAAAATLLNGHLTAARDRERQRAEEARRVRDFGARAAANARAAIADTNPDGVMLNTNEAMLEDLRVVFEQWRSTIRPGLLEFAVRTDSEEARRLSREIAGDIPRAINATAFLVREILDRMEQRRKEQRSQGSSLESWKLAKTKQESLLKLCDTLEETIRGD